MVPPNNKAQSEPLLVEPYRVYGEGDYALSNVREIAGTYEYFQLAEERRLCNKTQYEDCAAAEYMERGLSKCNCTPYHLRGYRKFDWGTIKTKVVQA